MKQAARPNGSAIEIQVVLDYLDIHKTTCILNEICKSGNILEELIDLF